MQFQFSFKHMDSSPALQTYAEEKIREKIHKFVTKPISAHVTFSAVRHHHSAHLSLDAGDGFSVQVEHSSDDEMHAVIDELVEKLNSQLRRQKERLKEHKGVKIAQTLDALGSAQDALRVVDGTADANAEEVDAGDIIKYEQSRKRASR